MTPPGPPELGGNPGVDVGYLWLNDELETLLINCGGALELALGGMELGAIEGGALLPVLLGGGTSGPLGGGCRPLTIGACIEPFGLTLGALIGTFGVTTLLGGGGPNPFTGLTGGPFILGGI